jgi:hypothetical protein
MHLTQECVLKVCGFESAVFCGAAVPNKLLVDTIIYQT